MIYNIIVLDCSLRHRSSGRFELALVLRMIVLLPLILDHLILLVHFLRIYPTVVFAPDYEFLMVLLVK